MSNPEDNQPAAPEPTPTTPTSLPGRRAIPLRPSALSKPTPTAPRLHLPGQKRTPLPAPSGQYRDFYIKPGQNGENTPSRTKQKRHTNIDSLLHGRVLVLLGVLAALAIALAAYAILRTSKTTPAVTVPAATDPAEIITTTPEASISISPTDKE